MITFQNVIVEPGADADLSVEALAEASGTSVRTIRWYQSEGLPPRAPWSGGPLWRCSPRAPPAGGRELQRRGLRLSAIAELLRRSPSASAADWLGLSEAIEQPWGGDRAELLSEEELAQRVEPSPVEDYVAAGLVERRDDTVPVVYLVPSPGLLDVAVSWTAAALDLDAAARLADLLAGHAGHGRRPGGAVHRGGQPATAGRRGTGRSCSSATGPSPNRRSPTFPASTASLAPCSTPPPGWPTTTSAASGWR